MKTTIPRNHVDHACNQYESGQQPRIGDVIIANGGYDILKVQGIRWDDDGDGLVLDCLLFEAGKDGGFREIGLRDRDSGVQPDSASLISRGCDEDDFSDRDDLNPERCFDDEGDAVDEGWLDSHKAGEEDAEDASQTDEEDDEPEEADAGSLRLSGKAYAILQLDEDDKRWSLGGGSDGFWYDITDGGYFKPREVLDPESADRVEAAIDLLRELEDIYRQLTPEL